MTLPNHKWLNFPIHRTQPDRTYMQTGLTDSPRADTASPAAKTLRAALMSRSWMLPHSGQTHSRTFNDILATVWPQSEQRLLLGYQRSIPTHTWNALPFFRLSSADISCMFCSQCNPQTSLLDRGTMWSTVRPFSFASLYNAAIFSLFAHAGMCGVLPRRIALWFLRCCFKCAASEETPPRQHGLLGPDLSEVRVFESDRCTHVFPFAPDGLPLSFSPRFCCVSGLFATMAFASDKDRGTIPFLFIRFRTATSLHPKRTPISLRDFLSTKYRVSMTEIGTKCKASFLGTIKRAVKFVKTVSISKLTGNVKPKPVGALDFHNSHNTLSLCETQQKDQTRFAPVTQGVNDVFSTRPQ